MDGATVYAAGGYCGHGPTMSNNVAEYTAFTQAIGEAVKHPGPILIRGDSKLVIMQLQHKWKINGGLYYPFYLGARAIYENHKNRIGLEWIPRAKNDLCDKLSKDVLHQRGIRFRIQPEVKGMGNALIQS